MKPRSICLHGPESTGKSTMVPRLAKHFGGAPCVAEFGRAYCEAFGTDLTMADLVEIGKGHDAKVRHALGERHHPVITDTDPLMTAVWADIMFGRRDPWFATWSNTADVYLLFDIDLPWVEDGSRMFGDEAARRRFFDLSQAILEERRVAWALVSGQGEARYHTMLAAIERLTRD
jgi:NadR type nicotinamide-nucleotide adenylyltransferase